MEDRYDVIIVGAGHNGLVAAAYLARSGRRVLALERRSHLGGAAATEELFPGYKVNTGAEDASLFSDKLVQELNLKAHGLRFLDSPTAIFSPQPDGNPLTLYFDPQASVDSIGRFNPKDGQMFPAFMAEVESMAGIVLKLMLRTPPDLAQRNLNDMRAWGSAALELRRMGKSDMMNFMRVLPMPVKSYLDEWFEGDALKGAIGPSGIMGLKQGPRAAGTTLMLLYQSICGLLAYRQVAGGIGQLSLSLDNAAREFGAEVRTNAEVRKIILNNDKGYKANGVRLADGQEISANIVLSNADPQNTFIRLVGPQNIDPTFMRAVRNITFRGSTAKVNLALDAVPEFNGQENADQLKGRIRISPSLDYLERAFDAAKYNKISPEPFLEVAIPTLNDPELAPENRHIMSILMRYAPFYLDEGDWNTKREELGDLVINTLDLYAPNLSKSILDRQIVTPLEWQEEYQLTEGSIHHGQMGLDQLLIMRPVPGWSRYKTPIENLYLCGAGTHPGGGVTGLPGYLAAQEVMRQQN
jgi:phytoene dehydrogenase-like protein